MSFGYIGIDQKNAGQDVRALAAFTESQKIDLLQRAAALGVTQCMVLSTCNRSEIYFYGEHAYPVMETLYREVVPDEAADVLHGGQDGEALEHLFFVAAGLESMVVGEDQILGQVREAYELSRTLGSSAKELNRIVQDAVASAKRIKASLHISEKPLSVSYVGIRRLKERFGIAGRRALVVGSGHAAQLAVRYLYAYDAASVTVCSRQTAHAAALKTEFPELCIVPFEKRYEAMADCTVIVSATASPHTVIRAGQIPPAAGKAFLDLASPRDVDPQIGKDALLIDLDSLQRIVEENQNERETLVETGRRMAAAAAQETAGWLQAAGVDKTLASLQQRCDEIVEDSCAYLNRKLELDAREQKLVRKILRASLKRLLREPILELKQTETREQQESYNRMLQELFHM